MLVRTVFVFFLLLILNSGVFAESSVYVVSKGKNELFLGGSIHLLRASDFPLPVEFDKAFEKSDMVVFETNLEQASSPEFGQRLSLEMSYTDGRTLETVLEPELWARLQVFSANSGFPLVSMKTFNPAFVSIIMTVFESQKQGISGGVETYFQAKMGDKKVGELENQDEVVAAMKKLAKVDGNAIMRSTLRDIEKFSALMDSAVSAWRKGDLDKLYSEMGKEMRTETPVVYESLLVDRNKRWLPKIEALLKTKEKEFVMVGALHLAGPDSLIRMLKKKGYKIKPFKVKK